MAKRVLFYETNGSILNPIQLILTILTQSSIHTLHYNHNYLLDQFDSIPGANSYNAKVYAAFGELEKDTQQQLKVPGSQFKSTTFSELDHMDTQIPTFIKGLQWVTTEPF